MNKKRLLKLADFLETVPPKKFNLRSWQTSAPTMPEAVAEGSCGFAGCAIGWAAHAKLFRGLNLVAFSRGAQPHLIFGDHEDWEAARGLFTLDYTAVHHLFDEDRYPLGRRTTPKQVAKRIRKFVETGVVT